MTARLRLPLSLYHSFYCPIPSETCHRFDYRLKSLNTLLNLDQGIRLRVVLLSLEWAPFLSILPPIDHSCLLTGIH